MKSMTGYGRGAASLGANRLAVETASVNKKNLDVATYLPREWQRLEIAVSKQVRGRVTRGRVTVNVSVESTANGANAVFDETTVSENLRQLEHLAKQLDIPFEPTADLLYRLAASPLSRTILPDPNEAGTPLAEALDEALDGLLAMRESEGKALHEDLDRRGETLAANVAHIREISGNAVENYREVLFKRLRQAGLDLDLEDERVLKEIAIFADRIDISEELIRLGSHLEQWRALLVSDDAVGRQLEFLLQEIGREINTIGSKAGDTAISRCVIASKNELEKMREQVQNVE